MKVIEIKEKLFFPFLTIIKPKRDEEKIKVKNRKNCCSYAEASHKPVSMSVAVLVPLHYVTLALINDIKFSLLFRDSRLLAVLLGVGGF